MAGIFDCGICDNAYNETERKPLVLLCGHTYCQQCLQNVVAETSPACPSCRKEIVSQVTELPVIFALIPPISSDETASKRVMSTKRDEKLSKPFETYLHDGQQWNITSNALAMNALFTMKETDHKTPKAIVKSTDEDKILCLPGLLQYLAASSASLELQLMDRAEKEYPEKKDWFPLMAGGAKSTNYNHSYRLKVLIDPLAYFQSLTAVTTTFGQVMNDSSQNKVIVLLYPDTHTYDFCVLAYGKIVKSDAGSWPLPLEVHVMGLTAKHWLWVKCSLPILYSMAQPKMGECRVYLPNFNGTVDLRTLFSFMAELGKMFSTEHRVCLPRDIYSMYCYQMAKAHMVNVEYTDF